MEPIGLIALLVVGGLSGWLANMVMKTNGQQDLQFDIVVGILGAFISSFLFNQFGSAGVTGFNIWSVFVSFIGAVMLLAVMHLVKSRGLFSR